MAYRPRTMTGRLAMYFGVTKAKIREWTVTGAALLCIVIALLAFLR